MSAVTAPAAKKVFRTCSYSCRCECAPQASRRLSSCCAAEAARSGEEGFGRRGVRRTAALSREHRLARVRPHGRNGQLRRGNRRYDARANSAVGRAGVRCHAVAAAVTSARVELHTSLVDLHGSGGGAGGKGEACCKQGE